MRKKVLLFGATGQVGSFLTEIKKVKTKGGELFLEWIPAPRNWDLRLCSERDEEDEEKDSAQLFPWKQEYETHRSVDYIVNLAAYTAVDQAEENKEEAWVVNGLAPGFLAGIAAERSCPFIHISTDYVFGSEHTKQRKREEYRPYDPPCPVNYYGYSKAEGEKRVLAAGGYVLRTSWVWGKHGFVDTMRRLATQGVSPRVVDDQWGRPTYAGDLAEAIVTLIAALSDLNEGKKEEEIPFLLHYSNSGPTTTWYEVAQFVFQSLKEKSGESESLVKIPRVSPCTTAEYPTVAFRPSWSVLDIRQWERLFGFSPAWQQSIREHLS